MIFLKRTIPLLICFLTGMIVALLYYIPHKTSEKILEELTYWDIIIWAFAIYLGAFALILQHYHKVEKQQPGWGYSLFMFLGVLLMLCAGLITRIQTESLPAQYEGQITYWGWMYNYAFSPLQSTMFSLLAFFIASAAFRAFRVKSFESAILLVAALIILFGRISLGQYLVKEIGLLFNSTAIVQYFVDTVEWVMDVLNMAARRGVLFGVVLGALATSLKIIFGIERSYLGRD